ncbi:MAG: single-stranded DNA-binding protein [Bdellovibrionales bacterium]|nr:single-stranded DNA-binding protein [Bdellovibrionales bacterium]
MRSLNKVFLLGRVGQNPELQTAKSGQQYTKLSIATQRSWKNQEGKWQEASDWHSVMVWGSQAKLCVEGIEKGSLVFVEGVITTYSASDSEGQKELKQSISGHRVSFFTTKARKVFQERLPELDTA